MRDLKELLLENGCSSEFIVDAMRYEHLFTGDVDAFLDKVEEILFNLNKERGVTLIIVTHDETLAAKCDRQIHIQDGKIISEGEV